MKAEEARVGMEVRVHERYRIAERQGMVGRIVSRYGGDEYVALDVRFADGNSRLFWPADLEEISAARPWWRSLLGKGSAE